MSKDDVMFAVAGVALGVILGFIIANSTTRAQTEARISQRETQASVNSSSGPELPPNHPNVGSRAQGSGGQQLPADHPPIGGSGQPSDSAAGGQPTASTELPSLEPLPAGSKEERAEQSTRTSRCSKECLQNAGCR